MGRSQTINWTRAKQKLQNAKIQKQSKQPKQ